MAEKTGSASPFTDLWAEEFREKKTLLFNATLFFDSLYSWVSS